MRRTISTIILALLPALAYAQPETWTDGARTTLAEDLDTTETGIDLTSGSAFPSTPTSPGYFTITVRSVATPSTFEIMRCTARSTNTLTCARDCVTGTCDNTGSTFSTGDNVYLSITAASLIRGLNGAGSTREVTFNESNVPGGADSVLIDNNTLVLREASTATLASSGVRVLGRRIGSNFPVRLSWFSPESANPRFAFPDPWQTYSNCIWPGASTALNTQGGPTYTTGGTFTISHPTPTNTTSATRRTRFAGTNNGAANTNGRLEPNNPHLFRGTSYAGALAYVYQFGFSTVNTTSAEVWIGLSSASGSCTDPSAATNIIAATVDPGETNWKIRSNDGSGTATVQTDCGANFPVNATAFYDLAFYAPNASSTVYVVMRRLDSSVADCTATITTDLPADGTALGLRLNSCTGSSGNPIVMETGGLCSVYPRELP